MSNCHKSREDEKNDHCKSRRRKWKHKHDRCHGEKKRGGGHGGHGSHGGHGGHNGGGMSPVF